MRVRSRNEADDKMLGVLEAWEYNPIAGKCNPPPEWVCILLSEVGDVADSSIIAIDGEYTYCRTPSGWKTLDVQSGNIIALLPQGRILVDSPESFYARFIEIDEVPGLEEVQPKTESQLRDEVAALRAKNRHLQSLLSDIEELARYG